jgi:hypothetical protein
MAEAPEANLLEYARKEPSHQFKRRLFELLCTGLLLAVPVYFFWWLFLIELGLFVHTAAVLTSPIPESTIFIVYGLDYRICALHMAAIAGLAYVFLSLKHGVIAHHIAQILCSILLLAIMLIVGLWFPSLQHLSMEHRLILWANLGIWITAFILCCIYCLFPNFSLLILLAVVPFGFILGLMRTKPFDLFLSGKSDFGKYYFTRWPPPTLFNVALALLALGFLTVLLVLSARRIKIPVCSTMAFWLAGLAGLGLTQFWFVRILAPLTYDVVWLGVNNHHEWNWLLHGLFIVAEILICYRIWCVFRHRDGGRSCSASSTS